MSPRVGLGIFLAIIGASAEAAVPGQSRTADLDRIRIHYTDYGAGDTAVIFVHGWACDETVWRGQAAALAEKVRVITLDLPGHGQSDKPDISYTMDLYARAIDAVLRDAHLQSAIVVGHSNGTPAVRQFYRQFPAETRALVIVDGPLKPFIEAASMQKFLAPMRENYQEAAGRLIDNITKPIASESLRTEIKTVMLRTPQHVAISEFESTANPELWKPDPIKVPVLMILAKQPAWSADYEKFVHELIPDLDYQMWAKVSHFLMMEKPEEFNAAVLAFLEKHRLVPNRS